MIRLTDHFRLLFLPYSLPFTNKYVANQTDFVNKITNVIDYVYPIKDISSTKAPAKVSWYQISNWINTPTN